MATILYQQFVEPVSTLRESVLLDKWFVQATEPVRVRPRPVSEGTFSWNNIHIPVVLAPRLVITKGSDVYRLAQSNYFATVPPTSSNDASQGYAIGAWWVDVVGANAYICVRESVGGAIWKMV